MKGALANKLNPLVRPKYKVFLRFLKDNGVFSRYFAIMRSNPEGYFITLYDGNLILFFNNVACYDWTTECFTWVKQKEGRDFWENIHRKWSSYSYKNLL